MNTDTSHITYSVVIPVYNESETLPILLEKLENVLSGLSESYEVILVNDGSKDDSLEILMKWQNDHPPFKIINLSRNFGHQIAITAGLDLTEGQAVMVMDGDLQDPPEVLPLLIEKWKAGYDVVYAIRKQRKEGFFKRMAYRTFYRVLNNISEVKIPIDAGDFGLMDRKIVDLLKKLPERNRFVRGIRSWVGYRQTGIEYERSERFAGDVKYTYKRLINLALDGLISFSNVPLRLMVYVGLSVSGFAFIGILVTLYKRFFEAEIPRGYTTILISILFIGGIQLIGMGLLGEYIGRVYDEVKQRPVYIIKGLFGFNDKSSPDPNRDSGNAPRQ